MSHQATSTVGAGSALRVPQTTMPRSVQAATSMERLRPPVVMTSFRFGSFSISARGSAMRSRIRLST